LPNIDKGSIYFAHESRVEGSDADEYAQATFYLIRNVQLGYAASEYE
jgi:hypothetical protein